MASSSEQADEVLVDVGENKSLGLDKNSYEYILRCGVAGGVAGSCAKTLIAPLDRIKILFQTSNPVFKQYSGSIKGMVLAGFYIKNNYGIQGFFQGHSATLIRIVPYAAIKFIAYEQIRNVLIPSWEYESHWRRMASGSIAGFCSLFVTYPLDLIRVRMAYMTALQNGGILKATKDIFFEPNTSSLLNKAYIPKWFAQFSNFYRGYTLSLIGMIPYAGLSFFSHDLFCDILKHPIIAKYSVLQENLGNQYDRSTTLRTWAQLFAGGLAGIAGQTAAYPFEIIRRRLQVFTLAKTLHKESIGIVKMAKIVFKESGWRGFFVGLSIGYLKTTPMVACSFYVYERMKWYLKI